MREEIGISIADTEELTALPQLRIHLVCDKTTGRAMSMIISTTGRGTWASPIEPGDFECPAPAGSV